MSAWHRFSKINYDIAKKLNDSFETPLFVIDTIGLKRHYLDFVEEATMVYPHSKVLIPYKTHCIPDTLRILHALGAGAEVSSKKEYQLAKMLGVHGKKIVFNGPCKKMNELEEAIKDRVIINIDNFEELNRLLLISERYKDKIPVGLRLCFKTQFNNWLRFGFMVDGNAINNIESPAYKACELIAKSKYLDLKGLHVHIGTGIRNHKYFEQNAKYLAQFAFLLKKVFFIELEWLDLGGGLDGINRLSTCQTDFPLSLPDLETYFRSIVSPLLKYLNCVAKPIILYFEPGRNLFEAFGALLTQVISLREQFEEIDNIPAIILDAGYNSLPTCFSHRHYNLVIHQPVSNSSENIQTLKILGPTCNRHDVIATSLRIKKPIVGDFLLFIGTGAYTIGLSFDFIRKKPKILLWQNNGDFDPVI